MHLGKLGYLINISITRRVALSQVGNWIQVRSGNRACPGTSSDTNHIVSCKGYNGFIKDENQRASLGPSIGYGPTKP